MAKIQSEALRLEVDADALVMLSNTDYFQRKLESITTESINGMPTDPKDIEQWGLKLAAQRDLLLRLKQEADSAVRDIEQAADTGDSDQ